jgi:acetylornithine/succinyldiaminopimelate/putrescine aminotransferase
MSLHQQECLQLLEEMKSFCPERQTLGISSTEIQEFLLVDPRLSLAIQNAYQNFLTLKQELPNLLSLSEKKLIEHLQEGYCNFYGVDALKPYVPLAAEGPWMITAAGAVVFNVGGYGMLSFGYNAPAFQDVIKKKQVMANIMTANFSQYRLTTKLQAEIGQNRVMCPYPKFISLNSGSEVVTLALTLTDVNSKIQTDPGAKHEGKKIMFMSLEGSFHGRTGRAARLSDSTAKYYDCLASFRDERRLITVPINDCVALQKIFQKIDKENIFIDSFFMEPVMGEGNPGKAVEPKFYQLARKLTKEHDTFLVVDSIQAGFRATGYMSIVDYPGFERLDVPDMETFAKSINGGEFPVSILALTDRAASLYRQGIYGNTMTGNPRGLDMISAMLEQMTPEVRKNINARGEELKKVFESLQNMYPDQILKVQGAGLLLSIALDPEKCPIMGDDGFELRIRKNGINVIHGGKNALRFTPSFDITSKEIQLLNSCLNAVFAKNVSIEASEEKNRF